MKELNLYGSLAVTVPAKRELSRDGGPKTDLQFAKVPKSKSRADQFVAVEKPFEGEKGRQETSKVIPSAPKRSIQTPIRPPEATSSKLGQLLEFDSAMAKSKAYAFAANEPFFFVVRQQGKGSLQPALEPCSSYYWRVDQSDNLREKRDAQVFYVSRRESAPRGIGSIETIESDDNPLAHHLLMVNNDVFCAGQYDPVEHEESLAASAILFDLGRGVGKNPAIAVLLLSRIPRTARAEIFGRVFVEALAEKDFAVANACLSHGATIASADREGGTALEDLIKPGLEEMLEYTCQQTALVTDLESLADAKKEAARRGLAAAAPILDRHLDRLKKVHLS